MKNRLNCCFFKNWTHVPLTLLLYLLMGFIFQGCGTFQNPKCGKDKHQGKISIWGYVYGAKLDGGLIPLSGAKVLFQDAVKVDVVFEAQTTKDGAYEAQGIPARKYSVLVFHPQAINFSGIEDFHLDLTSFVHERGNNEGEVRIRKNWILNECEMLKCIILNKKTKEKINDCKVILCIYKKPEPESVIDWDESKAIIPMKKSLDYLMLAYSGAKGFFEIPLCKNSVGKGFEYYLGSIRANEKGYKFLKFKMNWKTWIKEHPKEFLKIYMDPISMK